MRYYIIALLSCISALSNGQQSITGKIIHESEPVYGATIMLEGTNHGTTTDFDGLYELKNIPQGTYTISISYIGASTFTREVTITDKSLDIDAVLETNTQTVKEITVTGQRESQRIQQQAMQIESIDIEKISTSIRDLNEAIDQLPGVRVRTSGALGGRADISLNGLNGTAVRTYIDGIPMEFLYPNSNLGNLPLDNISRIDVYKGVLPVHVGTDAIGGGINIIPSQKEYTRLRASYSYGSFNTHQANINADYKLNDHVVLSANLSRIQSDNDFEMNAFVWEDNAIGKVRRFNDTYALNVAEVSALIKENKLLDLIRVTANYTDYEKDLQHGGVLGRLAYGDAHYTGNNQSGQIELRKDITDKISLKNVFALADEQLIYIDTSKNRYSWSGEVIAQLGRGELDQSSHATRNQLNKVNRTTLSIDLPASLELNIANLYASQRLNGRDTERAEDRDILQFDQWLTKNIAGIELRSTLLDDKLDLAVAYKDYRYFLDAVDFRAFSPISKDGSTSGHYFTTKYTFNKDFFVRGSYENAWRIPVYAQFFGNGLNIFPNANLSPESSNNFNLGFNYKYHISDKTNIRLEMNGFIRAQKDIIFLTAGEISKYENAEEVTSRGIEVDLETNIANHWTLNLNLTKIDKRYSKISDDNISAKFLEGTPFPNTPNLFGNVSLRYRHNDLALQDDNISVYASYKYVDEFNYINTGQIRNEENWVSTQHRLDAGWTYSLDKNKYSISFNMLNVLNKELFDNYAVPRPGRSYNVKLIYNYQQF